MPSAQAPGVPVSMNLDVVDLRSFYAERLGAIARRLIAERLKRCWDAAAGHRVLGLGYATPFLGLFADAERRLAFMPAAQGVVNWPSDGPNRTALVIDDALPLSDAVIDRALLVHVLEAAESPRDVLREIWRVLAPGGRVLLVVANRRGLWAHVESTPFGVGQPFSRGQLTALLRETMFSPVAWSTVLALPPIRHGLGAGAFWERLGGSLWPGLAGVLIVEATKQFYQSAPVRPRLRFSPALGPILVPRPLPNNRA